MKNVGRLPRIYNLNDRVAFHKTEALHRSVRISFYNKSSGGKLLPCVIDLGTRSDVRWLECVGKIKQLASSSRRDEWAASLIFVIDTILWQKLDILPTSYGISFDKEK